MNRTIAVDTTKREIMSNLAKKSFITEEVQVALSRVVTDKLHCTKSLLNIYRKAYWATIYDLNLLQGKTIHETEAPHSFAVTNEYIVTLRQLLQENIETETMQKDYSRTVHRTESLMFSLSLLQEAQNALTNLRIHPEGGERAYYVLYFSYFSLPMDKPGANMYSPRRYGSGYNAVKKAAEEAGVTLDIYSESAFYQIKRAAVELYGTILWKVTTYELIIKFLEQFN